MEEHHRLERRGTQLKGQLMTDSPGAERPEGAFFTSMRDWNTPRGSSGWIGGVIEGVGAKIGLAAAPARLIAFVALLVFNGLFVLAYAAAWALLPDRNGRIIIQDFGRGTPNVGALVMIALLALAGLGNINVGVPFVWGDRGDAGEAIGSIVFLGVIVFIIWLVARARGNQSAISG